MKTKRAIAYKNFEIFFITVCVSKNMLVNTTIEIDDNIAKKIIEIFEINVKFGQRNWNAYPSIINRKNAMLVVYNARNKKCNRLNSTYMKIKNIIENRIYP